MFISLDLYRIFREVAKSSSISKAAEKLFVSQSAVSQAIIKLEGKIGGKLFDRSVRGVKLTAEGEVLFSHIDDAITHIENAQAHFAQMQSLNSGGIKIGASDTICSMFLLPILNSFNDKHPNLQISVTNRVTQESIELLKQAAVDIAFINLPYENDSAIDIMPLNAIHDCFIAGGKYMALANEPISLGDLAKYPVLMLEKASNSRKQMDLFLKSKGIELSPAIELGSLALLSEFAKIGLGIAATIREEAQAMIDKGELRELQFQEELPVRHIGLARMKNVSLSYAADAFIAEMQAFVEGAASQNA
ncbi:MAG: LysR family transcriptional regulator [Eubacteriaceae bacterium]|nr:LysR family transcriptional regulator [Eubacteriaceae bacterium]